MIKRSKHRHSYKLASGNKHDQQKCTRFCGSIMRQIDNMVRLPDLTKNNAALMSFIVIILFFTAPDNSAKGNMTLSNPISPAIQLPTRTTAPSAKSTIATAATAVAVAAVAKTPFSIEIGPFSPELYDLSAFGDHEVHSD